MNDTQQQILEAATELFAQQGYARTSIRQIAEVAGANSALIYYYFGSKAELYRATLRAPASRLRSLLEEALQEEDGPAERLQYFVRGYVHFVLTQVGLTVLIFRSLASGDADVLATIRDRIAPNTALLTGIIADGIAAGEFRPVDPAMAVASLIGMVLLFAVAAPVAQPVLGMRWTTRSRTGWRVTPLSSSCAESRASRRQWRTTGAGYSSTPPRSLSPAPARVAVRRVAGAWRRLMIGALRADNYKDRRATTWCGPERS